MIWAAWVVQVSAIVAKVREGMCRIVPMDLGVSIRMEVQMAYVRVMRPILLATLLLFGCNDGAHNGTDASDPTGDDDDDTTGDDDDDSAGDDAGTGDTDPLSVNRGGSRIKMRVGTTPDGARAFLGWHDTMTDDDCAFSIAADGQQRCLPSAQSAFIQNFFSDSGCSQPLGYVSTSNCSTLSPPKYAYSFELLCTSNVYVGRYHLVTAAHTGTVYSGSPTSCTVWTSPGFQFYRFGPELPSSTFQAATESLE
jgi:hypothetical protein